MELLEFEAAQAVANVGRPDAIPEGVYKIAKVVIPSRVDLTFWVRYLVVKKDQGHHTLALYAQAPGADRVLVAQVPLDVNIRGVNKAAVGTRIQVGSFEVTAPGVAVFELRYDGRRLGDMKLTFEERSNSLRWRLITKLQRWTGPIG